MANHRFNPKTRAVVAHDLIATFYNGMTGTISEQDDSTLPNHLVFDQVAKNGLKDDWFADDELEPLEEES